MFRRHHSSLRVARWARGVGRRLAVVALERPGSRPGVQARATSHRHGFTLVELLVIITIITILAGLTLRVVVGLVNEGREAGTRSTIQKIHRVLDSRLQAFQRRYGNNDDTTVARVKATLEWQVAGALRSDSGGGTFVALNDNARLVATRKLLYIKYFPQSAWEVDSSLQPGLAAYRQTLIDNSPTGNIEAEATIGNITNAEVLYDLVLRAATLGDSPVEGDVFLATESFDEDGDGFPEFRDAWGKAIRFYRWPVLLFRPDFDPANPTNLNPAPTGQYAKALLASYPPSNSFDNQLKRDPLDPLGLLGNVRDLAIGGDVLAGVSPARRVAIAGFNVPFTFHAPMIVSAGTDGEFGILEPIYGGTTAPSSKPARMGYLGQLDKPSGADAAATTAALDRLQDNISSLRIRAGGR